MAACASSNRPDYGPGASTYGGILCGLPHDLARTLAARSIRVGEFDAFLDVRLDLYLAAGSNTRRINYRALGCATHRPTATRQISKTSLRAVTTAPPAGRRARWLQQELSITPSEGCSFAHTGSGSLATQNKQSIRNRQPGFPG